MVLLTGVDRPEVDPPESDLTEPRLTLRDWIAGAALFVATACVILWQNAHVAVLWDLGYVLDSASRMAAGQVPYREFPFAHAPLTFLVQAVIIRLTGRVYYHHVVYCALVGGLGTVLAWRIALHMLRGRVRSAWTIALLLAAPLTVLGIYCIFPFPSYDCDCAFWILVALYLLQRVTRAGRRQQTVFGIAAGVSLCVPVFFKQNMGLPFLAAAIAAAVLLLALRRVRKARISADADGRYSLAGVLAGAMLALPAAVLLLHFTAGIGNYLHWTFGFAAQRRLPGFSAMLGAYLYPSLAWQLPCIVIALILFSTVADKRQWTQIAAFVLMSAPFLFTLASLVIYDDVDERSDTLLELWPMLLVLAAVLALVHLVQSRHKLTLGTLLPFVLLVAVNGTMLSQQLWGSTYAIWPLLMLLIPEILIFLDRRGRRRFAPALSMVMAATLVVCGGFYTASEDRLSYIQLPEGTAAHSAFPQLAGMATPGPYIPEFDELLRYAKSDIPVDDGILLLPGEEPFYFATGRVPQFPITLFDPTTDPYSPEDTAALARARDIRWLIVKRDLQINADPTPQRAETIAALKREFTLTARLSGYDVYRLNGYDAQNSAER